MRIQDPPVGWADKDPSTPPRIVRRDLRLSPRIDRRLYSLYSGSTPSMGVRDFPFGCDRLNFHFNLISYRKSTSLCKQNLVEKSTKYDSKFSNLLGSQ
jgi:hypothetical protein